MNKLLEKLYEQAHITTTRQVIKGGWDNDRPPYEMVSKTTTEFDPEVFAKLIITECIDNLKSQQVDIYTINNLKRHFGVEE